MCCGLQPFSPNTHRRPEARPGRSFCAAPNLAAQNPEGWARGAEVLWLHFRRREGAGPRAGRGCGAAASLPGAASEVSAGPPAAGGRRRAAREGGAAAPWGRPAPPSQTDAPAGGPEGGGLTPPDPNESWRGGGSVWAVRRREAGTPRLCATCRPSARPEGARVCLIGEPRKFSRSARGQTRLRTGVFGSREGVWPWLTCVLPSLRPQTTGAVEVSQPWKASRC